MMYFFSSLLPEERFTSSWWPLLSESLKYGSALWGFVKSKAPGGEEKNNSDSFVSPASLCASPSCLSQCFVPLHFSSILKHTVDWTLLLPNCEQCTSYFVFRGHSWKPRRSWKSFSYSSFFQQAWRLSMLKMQHCSACSSRLVSLVFIPGVLGRESSLAGKKGFLHPLYWWFDH